MALLRYFKLAGGLSHPKCSLSSAIDPEIIAEMNKEVEEASHSEAKQGPYSTYSSSVFTDWQVYFYAWVKSSISTFFMQN